MTHSVCILCRMSADLASLVSRLEKVTTKLEGIASSGGIGAGDSGGKYFVVYY